MEQSLPLSSQEPDMILLVHRKSVEYPEYQLAFKEICFWIFYTVKLSQHLSKLFRVNERIIWCSVVINQLQLMLRGDSGKNTNPFSAVSSYWHL